MRSVSATSILVAAAIGPLFALGLSGCETTQDAAARLKIRSARVLAGRKPVKVGERAADVKVLSADLIRGKGEAAVVVELRNKGGSPVNDLPIAVGVRGADGDKTYLNGRADLPYFQTHAPALAAGETGTWVYAAKDDVAAGEAFAEVGAAATPPITVAASLPELDLGSISKPDGSKTTVDVANSSGFPQYDLTVFAWVTKDDRYLAAGAATAGDLDADESEPVAVKLIGDPADGDVHVSAPPTIFQ